MMNLFRDVVGGLEGTFIHVICNFLNVMVTDCAFVGRVVVFLKALW